MNDEFMDAPYWVVYMFDGAIESKTFDHERDAVVFMNSCERYINTSVVAWSGDMEVEQYRH